MPDTLVNLTTPARRPVLSIAAPALSDGPASEAWIVVPTYRDGQRLCFIKRGDKRAWLPKTDTTGMSVHDLKRIADQWNEEAGVSPEAAGALDLDWGCAFKIPATDPGAYAEYRADQESLWLFRKGVLPGRRYMASAGWLAIVVATHGLPMNPPICPGSIRHTWLTAHYEVTEWAAINARKAPRSLLPTERAALRVTEAASALHAASSAYRGYSRQQAQFFLELGDKAAHDRIRSLDRTERRELLLKLRAERRPLLRAFFKAVGRYAAARAALAQGGR